MSRTTARHRKPDQRSSGRPSVAPQRSSSGPSVARQHRKSSPIVSVLQNKPARAAAAAVAGSALLVAAWPTASHRIAALPHASGAGQADALGLAPVGAHRSPAHQPAAADVYASGQPAATLGVLGEHWGATLRRPDERWSGLRCRAVVRDTIEPSVGRADALSCHPAAGLGKPIASGVRILRGFTAARSWRCHTRGAVGEQICTTRTSRRARTT